MTTWVALLRGINVGGNNRLPMAELATIIEAAGGRDVRTYIQSGNAVFDADPTRTADALAEAIRLGIDAASGFAPHVLVRSAADLRRIADANPFPVAADEPKTLHVFFLDRAPDRPDLAAIDALRQGREACELVGDACYLHTPDGFGTSKLAVKLEKHLGVPATARNWSTVTALLGLVADR